MSEFTKDELNDLYYAIRFFWKNRSTYDLPSDTEEFTNSHDLMIKIDSMIENYHKPCTHKKLRRISFLNGKDYDICGNCDYIKRMR